MEIVSKKKFKTANGFTKASIRAIIDKEVKEFSGYTEKNDLTGFPQTHCFYKDNKGNKCGVGAFIPEGHAGQKFRGTVSNLLRTYPDLQSYMPLEFAGLHSLQIAHDMNRHDTKKVLLKWVDNNVEE